jgi:hypothetical protein
VESEFFVDPGFVCRVGVLDDRADVGQGLDDVADFFFAELAIGLGFGACGAGAGGDRGAFGLDSVDPLPDGLGVDSGFQGGAVFGELLVALGEQCGGVFVGFDVWGSIIRIRADLRSWWSAVVGFRRRCGIRG